MDDETHTTAPILIRTDEKKSNFVNCSPSNLYERIELNTRFKDEIEDTVIMSVIDRVPNYYKTTINITDENEPGHCDA